MSSVTNASRDAMSSNPEHHVCRSAGGSREAWRHALRSDLTRSARRRIVSLACLSTMMAALACDTDPVTPGSPGAFEYEVAVGNERFVVRADSAADDSALTRRWQSGAIGPIVGEVRATSGGFNDPWHWHLHPSTVHVIDGAPWSACGGLPSQVEAAMRAGGWPAGRFCPSDVRVTRRRARGGGH